MGEYKRFVEKNYNSKPAIMRTTIELKYDVHRALKIHCVEHDIPIKHFITELITKAIKK